MNTTTHLSIYCFDRGGVVILNAFESIMNESMEPIIIGIYVASRISSIPGSPNLSISQPLISTRLFSASGILIGAQFLLLLAKIIFKLDNVSVLDVSKNQLIQMPIVELQNLLMYLGSRQNNIAQGISTASTPSPPAFPTGTSIGFPTVLPPEAPLIISLFIAADYSNELFTPSTWFLVPILSFPGLRGSLPILILSLLATIFVRSVVPPETTGSKPLVKASERPNPSLSLYPEELLAILNRFGKYFRFP